MRIRLPLPALLLLVGGWTCPHRVRPDRPGYPVRESPSHGQGRDG
jgi:hypothetical protein